jgi:hypothetical protein
MTAYEETFVESAIDAGLKYVASTGVLPCARCFCARFARSVVTELMPFVRQNRPEVVAEFLIEAVECAADAAIVTECHHYQ